MKDSLKKKLSLKDRIKQRAKTREGHGRGNTTLNLPKDMEFLGLEKRMSLNILPYRVTVDNHPEAKKGELWYERTYFIHRNIGPEQTSVVCPTTIGKKCPICEEYNKLRKDPDADEDVVKALRRSERQMFNVIDTNHSKSGVQLMTASTFAFGDKLEEEIREGADELGSFPYLKGGKTLNVRFTEVKIGTGGTFMKCSRIDFEDRDDIEEEVLEEVADLDKIMNILSYDALEKLFLQNEDEDEKEEDEDDAGDSDAESDEDGDEEDEKPKRKIKKSAKDEDDNDDSDDEDEESDSEDEKSDEDESAADDDGEEDDEDADESDDDEDDDRGKSKKGKVKKSSKKDDDDDEESDGDDEDSDGDDEDAEDDEEDGDKESDDDEDDEDEEPVKPSRRRK